MYSDDLINLQDSIDALVEVLSKYGDCIISGCEISGSAGNYRVSAGYVRIDGKLRKFPGGSFSAYPFYIVPDNEIIQTLYKDNVTRDAIGVYGCHLSLDNVSGALGVLEIADEEDKRDDNQLIVEIVEKVRKYAGPSHFYVSNALTYNKTAKKYSTSEIEDAKEGDLCNYLTKVYKCTTAGLGSNAVWEFAYDYHTGAVGVCMGGDIRCICYGPWEMEFSAPSTELTYEAQDVEVTLSAQRTISVYDGYTGNFISETIQEGEPILSVNKHAIVNGKTLQFPANATDEKLEVTVTALMDTLEKTIKITQAAQYEKYVISISYWYFDDALASGIGGSHVMDRYGLQYSVKKYNNGVYEDVTESAQLEYGVSEMLMAGLTFDPGHHPNDVHIYGFKNLGSTSKPKTLACILYLTVSIVDEETGKIYSETITRNVYQQENSLSATSSSGGKFTLGGYLFEEGDTISNRDQYGTVIIPKDGGAYDISGTYIGHTIYKWTSGKLDHVEYDQTLRYGLTIATSYESDAIVASLGNIITTPSENPTYSNAGTFTAKLTFPPNNTGETLTYRYIKVNSIYAMTPKSIIYQAKDLVEETEGVSEGISEAVDDPNAEV